VSLNELPPLQGVPSGTRTSLSVMSVLDGLERDLVLVFTTLNPVLSCLVLDNEPLTWLAAKNRRAR